jgi:hypothetical protein
MPSGTGTIDMAEVDAICGEREASFVRFDRLLKAVCAQYGVPEDVYLALLDAEGESEKGAIIQDRARNRSSMIDRYIQERYARGPGEPGAVGNEQAHFRN